MNNTKSEAREFILVKEKLSNAALAFDLAFDLDPFIPQNWPPSSYVDTLHVIEKSAYAYAVDQWDYWVEEARKAQAKHERVLQALEIAEKAVNRSRELFAYCAGPTRDVKTGKLLDGARLCSEAIAEIESLKK